METFSFITLSGAVISFLITWIIYKTQFYPTVLKIFFNKNELNKEERTKGLFFSRERIPGPYQVPIFGSIPHIILKVGHPFKLMRLPLFKFLDELKRIWGPLISIRVGNNNTILIDDLKLVKKLMASEEWSNRMQEEPMWKVRTFDQNYGLLTSNGESWKEMRRYIQKTLIKFGFGRSSSLEMRHEDEILKFFDYLDEKLLKSDGVIQIQGVFNITALNILWTMVASQRFAYDSKEISELTHLLEEFAAQIHTRKLGFLVFSWLRFIPKLTGYFKMMDNTRRMQEYFRKIINERRALGNFKTEQNNFVDAFLSEIDYHKDNKIEPNYYTDEQLIMVLLDLFLTGFLPIASCLEYLIMFMILNPEIQSKCQDEIDSVIGRNRYPSINDSESLPYVQAVCIEVLRKVTFIPITTRATTKDTYLDGYFVPKDTVAAINLYSIHNNPEVWDKPDEFRPERFLDEDGKANQEKILPFGTGKRVCPAEVFGRLSTFTFFTYLLQRYKFEIPAGYPAPDPTPDAGMGNYPKPFFVAIQPRC